MPLMYIVRKVLLLSYSTLLTILCDRQTTVYVKDIIPKVLVTESVK